LVQEKYQGTKACDERQQQQQQQQQQHNNNNNTQASKTLVATVGCDG